MTTFTAISNTTAEKDKPLTQSLVRALRDNPLAIAEGDVTAPKVKLPALGGCYIAGDWVQASSNATAPSSGGFPTSYAKYKEIKVPFGGAFRIKWSVLGSNATKYTRVYVNGTAVGVEKTTPPNNDPIEVSDDISGVNAGDLVQLYARSSVGGVGQLSSFRICADQGFVFEVVL
jgi:hypothetical protein